MIKLYSPSPELRQHSSALEVRKERDFDEDHTSFIHDRLIPVLFSLLCGLGRRE